MVNLQFGQYKFPHNPKKLRVITAQQLKGIVCAQGGEITQRLGRGRTVIEGEGEFYGPQAMHQYEQLRLVFEQGEKAVLFGAGVEPMEASPQQLELVGQGGAGTVGYRFRFIEDDSRKQGEGL